MRILKTLFIAGIIFLQSPPAEATIFSSCKKVFSTVKSRILDFKDDLFFLFFNRKTERLENEILAEAAKKLHATRFTNEYRKLIEQDDAQSGHLDFDAQERVDIRYHIEFLDNFQELKWKSNERNTDFSLKVALVRINLHLDTCLEYIQKRLPEIQAEIENIGASLSPKHLLSLQRRQEDFEIAMQRHHQFKNNSN